MALPTIRSRRDFLAIRGGARSSVPAFLLEAKLRTRETPPGREHRDAGLDGFRFGFTITKKLGGAVTRNRIRRRLKAAFTAAAVPLARPGFDYVVVARSSALERPFELLLQDVAQAMSGVHRSPASGRPDRLDKSAGPVKKPVSRGSA